MTTHTTVWVYVQSESNLWTVGYYTPEGNWNTDSDHDSPDAAAARVHYLNGGCQQVSVDVLAALEDVLPHLPHLGPIFDNPDLECGPKCPRHRADAAIASAKGTHERS